MFETDELGRLTGGQLLQLAASNHQAMVEAENRSVMIAAAWADDQDRDPGDDYAPLIHRASESGGTGTPAVSEFAAAELGAVLGVGIGSGRALIADALDLRHRLPLAWSRLCAGHIRAWQARKLAQTTRWLGFDEAGEVDAAVSGFLGAMPWPRFERILTAAILQADPEAVAERAERARTERMVRAFDSDDGLRTVVARATSGDVTWFMATVNRIAEILELEGSSDAVDIRRSRAVGILARPALALKLLLAHRDDPGRPPDLLDPARVRQLADDRHRNESLFPEPGSAAELAAAIRGVDPEAFRPRVILYFHLAEAALSESGALVRPEHGPALSLAQLHEFLSDTGCRATVRPVVTPADQAPVDCYEIPHRIREAVRLRHLVDVFPYASCAAAEMDLDHTVAYRSGGPPGQTGLHNLGPLSRTSHRHATPGPHAGGRWRKRQPDPGTFLWRSPHGWTYLVTADGTLNLGTAAFARAVWQAATATGPSSTGRRGADGASRAGDPGPAAGRSGSRIQARRGVREIRVRPRRAALTVRC